MIFNWFLIFNKDIFLDTGLVSRKILAIMDGIGTKQILITKGNELSVTYEDVILPIGFNGENPYVKQGDAAHYAVYLDTNGDVYLGIEVPA